MKRKYEEDLEIRDDDIPVTNHEVIECPYISNEDEAESDFSTVESDSRSDSPELDFTHGGYCRETYIKYQIGKESLDLIGIGKNIVLGTVDKTLDSNRIIDKATKKDSTGLINIEQLVKGLAQENTVDQRFSMVGSALCWNLQKTSLKSMLSNLSSKSTKEINIPFKDISFNILNLQNINSEAYQVIANDPFLDADLPYIFGLLTFRDNAKLLNKTKQFLKAYFVVSCRPRCFIWRYTLRKSGATHKKTISHLPTHVLNTVINFLLDLCGVGRFDTPFRVLDNTKPFFFSLGTEDPEGAYEQICQSRDELIEFFKNAITDCLNEIREMPYLMDTGVLTTPLRGRPPSFSTITWKQYETLLKLEIANPSNDNIQNRVNFEHMIFTSLPIVTNE